MADESAATNPDSTAPPVTANQTVDVNAQPNAPVQTQDATPSTSTIAPVAAPSPNAAPTSQAASTPPDNGDNFATKVFHGIMGALGGTQDTTFQRDPATGKMVVSQTPSGTGSQWKRIIAGATAGTAAALGTPGGPGQLGRAAGAGLNAGSKTITDAQSAQRAQADQDANLQQTALLRKAQTQMLTYQGAEAAFNLSRLQIDAKSQDTDRENNFVKLIQQGGNGSQDLGVAQSFNDVLQMHKDMPNLVKENAQGNIVQVPHVDADGKFDGVRFALVTPQWKDAKLDTDQSFYTLKPPTKVGDKPTVQQMTVKAGTMTNGDFVNRQTAAAAQILAQHKQDFDEGEKLKTDNSTVRKNAAETTRDYAEAGKATAEAKAASTKDAGSPQVAQLGEAIARGGLSVDQIPGFAKIKPAVEAYLSQHHPNLDQTSVMLDAGQRKQINLANNAIHNLDDISTRLQRRPDLLGKINGLVTQGKELTGTDDRDLADINTALDNYALASTGAHGIRAVQARADAKKALLNGFKNGPQGVQASMSAAKGSLQNLASAGKPRSINGTPYIYKQQPAPGTPQTVPSGAAVQPGAAATGFNWGAHPVAK